MAQGTAVTFDIADGRTCAIALPPDNGTTSQFAGGMTLMGTRAVIAGGGDGNASDSLLPAGAVVANAGRLWDAGQTVTYSFLSGTTQQQNKVKAVIQNWYLYANVVFSPVATGGMLRITFDPKGGSWSYIGKDSLKVDATKPTINFGWVEDTKSIEAEERGVILHEFGHVLGTSRHQSPARGGTLTLDNEAVYGYYTYTQGWDRATVKAQIIDVFNADTVVSNYSRLDTESIMMYFMPSWLNLQRIEVKANYVLSPIDMAYMVINYPRPKPHAEASKWTLEYALRVAEVDEATVQSILFSRADVSQNSLLVLCVSATCAT
ncbi:ZnMc domain-containing protein [Mycena indigotica]|uniref:ZnMc domain-containing protein n=1 Tax=Mycena indigotica TaxID=2126181 RepID=A0A8H6S5R5_9AGAR|nr:ZnMc domain-containing protein [Mycena indigotica]KAF7292571.1 ZnMc domain-containing protein [Mycena indigotica]